jgi:hypothetical protein
MNEQVDSNGHGPSWRPGERAWVAPLRAEATVIQQLLSYDGGESFWGNVELEYDDGVKGVSNSWQLVRIVK